FCIPKNLVNGLNTLETISIHPSSRKNCIISISGKITAANCNTAMNAVFTPCITIAGQEDSSECTEEIKPNCTGSEPPLNKPKLHQCQETFEYLKSATNYLLSKIQRMIRYINYVKKIAS